MAGQPEDVMRAVWGSALRHLSAAEREHLEEFLKPSFVGVPSDDQLLALGYAQPVKRFAGCIAAIMPMGAIDVLAVGIHPWGHHDAYYYRRGQGAAALNAWDGSGEPAGWDRHPQSGRRRRNGDASQEYFQP
jgi:hypothetical protein